MDGFEIPGGGRMCFHPPPGGHRLRHGAERRRLLALMAAVLDQLEAEILDEEDLQRLQREIDRLARRRPAPANRADWLPMRLRRWWRWGPLRRLRG